MTSKIKPHGNTNTTNIYKIVIKESEEVVAKFRLKVTAINNLPRLQKIYLKELEIQEVVL